MRPYENLTNQGLERKLSILKQAIIENPINPSKMRALKFLEKEFIHRFPEPKFSNRERNLTYYQVKKRVDGKTYYYGEYKTREEADSVKKLINILHE